MYNRRTASDAVDGFSDASFSFSILNFYHTYSIAAETQKSSLSQSFFKFFKVFYVCCKSLSIKHLRARGGLGPVSRWLTRTYVTRIRSRQTSRHRAYHRGGNGLAHPQVSSLFLRFCLSR